MKRLYLVQQDNDYIDIDYHFNLAEESEYLKYAIEDGRICEYLFPEYEKIVKDFDDFLYDFETLEKKLSLKNDTYSNLCNYYFPKTNGKKYSTRQIKAYKDLYKQICEHGTYDYRDYVCDILRLMTGEIYTTTTIHGCSQGEYAEVIHKASMTKEYIDYIEARYFCTGTEYHGYIVDSEEVLTVDELQNDEDEFCDYTAEWDEDKYKAKMSERYGLPVVLYLIADTYTVRHYTYKVV